MVLEGALYSTFSPPPPKSHDTFSPPLAAFQFCSSYKFSYKKKLRNFPIFFELFLVGQPKIPQNSHQISRQIPLRKSKKITDELLQERMEKTFVTKFASACECDGLATRCTQQRTPKRGEEGGRCKTSQGETPTENSF